MTASDVPFTTNAQDDESFQRLVAAMLERERAKREARKVLAIEDRGDTPPPEILTLRERLARPREAQRWRIEHWQPRESRVMLVAQFKAGKTTLVANLLRSLVDGDDWLDRDRVQPVIGTVALADTEMGGKLYDWLQEARIRNDDRVVTIPLRGQGAAFDLLDPDVRRKWAGELRGLGVRYLVLDCLRPVLDALGLDEHRDAGRFLVALDTLLNDADIPEALVVHHMGHLAERARGDSRLRDWPDCEWRLMRQDDNPSSARFITAYGRDVDVSESQLSFDVATRRLSLAGGSRRDAKADAALVAVLEVLVGAPSPLSGRAIKAALAESDHARDTIDAALRLGITRGNLTTESGARNAKLYRSVSECPGVSDECPETTACECPAASIEADTRTLAEVPSDEACEPHTRKRFRFDPSQAFLPPAVS